MMAGKVLAMMLCVVTAVLPSCASKEDRVRKAFRSFRGPYVIFVSKKEFRLEVYDRGMRMVADYAIAYGANPDGKAKLHEGDNRTPEGVYAVNEILSMDADRNSPACLTLRNMNRQYFRAREGHARYGEPEADLGDNAYGPRYIGLDYPNAEDRTRYRRALDRGMLPVRRGKAPGIGQGIAIHGNNDEKSIGHRSSNGCLRMYNRDIVELDQYIRLGTPVIISAD